MDLECKQGGVSNLQRAYRVETLKEEKEKEGELTYPEDDESLMN